MLQQQPAVGLQVRWRLGHDGADVFEPIRAAGQGLQGFVGECCQVRIGAGDVGRIGDDGVKQAVHARKPAGV
ncbi:hypothetical protein D3C71_1840330 [compost metagenome]